MPQVYRHSEERVYRANICSKAAVIYLFGVVVTFALPFVIWSRIDERFEYISFHREQPNTRFLDKLILLLDTPNETFVHSTFESWNDSPNFVSAAMEVAEIDWNSDLITDLLKLSFSVPIRGEVLGVRLYLFCETNLRSKVALSFPSVIAIEASSLSPANRVLIATDARVAQRGLLRRKMYQGGFSSTTLSEFSDPSSIESLLAASNGFNFTLETFNMKRIWSSDRLVAAASDGAAFTIDVEIRLIEQTLQVASSFWLLLKQFWIQYISIWIVVAIFVSVILGFTYRNQLVPTYVSSTVEHFD